MCSDTEPEAGMHCPFCHFPDSRVVDSREADDGAAIRRRRSCPECGRRFTTLETASLTVVKRSGASEPFSRVKVIDGVRKAFSGRPVDEDALARLGQQVEVTVRATGAAEVEAHEIGLAILEPLGELDEVAFLRFASVYKSFTSAEDFGVELAALRARRDQLRHRPESAAVGRYAGAHDPAPPSQVSLAEGGEAPRELAPLSP
jgi:transcriptional repressor NrdR